MGGGWVPNQSNQSNTPRRGSCGSWRPLGAQRRSRAVQDPAHSEFCDSRLVLPWLPRLRLNVQAHVSAPRRESLEVGARRWAAAHRAHGPTGTASHRSAGPEPPNRSILVSTVQALRRGRSRPTLLIETEIDRSLRLASPSIRTSDSLIYAPPTSPPTNHRPHRTTGIHIDPRQASSE